MDLQLPLEGELRKGRTKPLGPNFGKSAGQEGKRDRGVGIDRDFLRLEVDLSPGGRLFKRAAGEAAPVRGIRRDLDAVFMALHLVSQVLGRHFRLLRKVLGRPSADENDSGSGRFRGDLGGFADILNRMKQKILGTVESGHSDPIGGIADRGGVNRHARLVRRRHDSLLLFSAVQRLPEFMKPFPGRVRTSLQAGRDLVQGESQALHLAPGRRFRVEETTIFDFFVTAQVLF